MKIAIIDTLGSPYDGNTPYKQGLGGSESAVVYIAEQLARQGEKVDVYCDCDDYKFINGVYYFKNDDYDVPDMEYDVIISSRSVVPFTKYNWPNSFKVVWMHDTFCAGDEMLESMLVNNQINEVWTLSDWHSSYVMNANHGHRRMMEVIKRKQWVTRNGAKVFSEHVDMAQKDRNHFVFNAAVNKGMRTLLEDVWPRVREKCPDAYLTVIGGSYNLREADIQNDELAKLQEVHHNNNEVHFTGYITQERVSKILENAGFTIYPQTLPETYGISVIESLVAGTPVISGRFGGMEETAVNDACYLMDYPVDSNVLYTFNKEVHVEAFVNMAVAAYWDSYRWQQKCQKALEVREVCDWSDVAKQWRQHLYRKTNHYLPVSDTRACDMINYKVNNLFGRRAINPEYLPYPATTERKLRVIVPCYNAQKYIDLCLYSILAQNYDNYEVIIIDDASTDGTAKLVKEHVKEPSKVTLIENEHNYGALSNQVHSIMSDVSDDIIVLIDGDDALMNDPNIFRKINTLYDQGAEFTYGSCWSLADNIALIAQEYPPEVIRNKTFKEHRFPWNMPYTHLRTFTVDLFNRIDLNDLRDSDGSYYKAGGDAALFYALIEKAREDGIFAVKQVTYRYNDLNPINDYKVNSPEQTRNAARIMGNALYKPNKKILIAIPTAQNIHAQTFKSIYDLEVPEGYETDFQFFYGYNIDQVRNLIASWVVNGPYDYLFAVDYDISFAPDTLKKLLASDKDVVSGLYIQRKPGQHILELYRTEPHRGMYNIPWGVLQRDSLEEVDACGFGCVLIKKEVMVAIGYPQFIYKHALTIEDTLSEDVYFCTRAKENGFTIWADTSVLCKHHGMTEYTV